MWVYSDISFNLQTNLNLTSITLDNSSSSRTSFIFIYVYTGGTEEERRLGKGVWNPGAGVAGSETDRSRC